MAYSQKKKYNVISYQKMEIKTTVRYYCTPSKRDKIKNTEHTKDWLEYGVYATVLFMRKQYASFTQWKWKSQSCLTLCNPMDYSVQEFSRSEYWRGSFSLLQGIFPTQGSNPGLPHCRQIFYQLSHDGSPRILEWVAYPFSSRSSQHRSQTIVSCIAGRFFPNWAMTQ